MMTGAKPEFDGFECPSFDIAAYIDGELDEERESDLDGHFASCPVCTAELNDQKQFLCGLNSSLMNESEIDLPHNFAKTIVANAESSVTGLRRPAERFNAVFICVALLLFGLFALGADSGSVLGRSADIAEKLTSVALFIGHVAYSFAIGLCILTRSLCGHAQIPEVISLVSVVLFVTLFLGFSRRLFRFRRI